MDQKPFHSEGKDLGGGSLSTGPSSTNSDGHTPGTEADVDPGVVGTQQTSARLAGGEAGFEGGETQGACSSARESEPSLSTCLCREAF